MSFEMPSINRVSSSATSKSWSTKCRDKDELVSQNTNIKSDVIRCDDVTTAHGKGGRHSRQSRPKTKNHRLGNMMYSNTNLCLREAPTGSRPRTYLS